jgi:excisionase family DNA binding protein
MTDQREPPAPTEQADLLLDTAQVAEKLGVSEETVRRYARTGSIASIRLPGGTRRFKTSVIDAVIAGSGDPF